jgi:membrane protein
MDAPAEPTDINARHGHAAVRPAQALHPRWKDVLLRTWEAISQDRVMLVAAGVTYYGLLALFPALTAFVSL